MTVPILRSTLLTAILLLTPLASYAAWDHFIELTVTKGDSLYRICERLLENPEDWRWVAMVNRIRNPDMIFPGEELKIPTRLLKGVPVDGVVTFVKGDACVFIDETEGWRQLDLHDRIAQGSRLRTGEDGSIEITFEDSFSVLLRPESTVEVTAARRKGALYLLYRLFLKAGKTISKLQEVTGTESRHEIQTPSSVAAARGTEFRTAVDAAGTTRLEVLAGEVDVEAARKDVRIKAGEGTLVEKGRAPVAPRKLLPAPVVDVEPLYRSLPLAFRFALVPGAVSYRAMLARDNAMKDVVREKVIRPDDAFEIIGIQDGTYFLQGCAIDEVGLEGVAPAPVEVHVRINPLPPFIESPADGSDHRTGSVLLKWMKVSQASQYRVQVAGDPDFTAVLDDTSDISGLFHRTGELEYGTYFFRVSSIASDGYQGIWSDALCFNVVPPPPAPPLEKPQLDDDTLRIRWRDLGAGIRYHFQMAGDEAFTRILKDETLPRPEIVLTRPDDVGTYYVRTSAIDADGYEGAFSEPQSFEILNKYRYWSAGIFVLVILGFIVL